MLKYLLDTKQRRDIVLFNEQVILQAVPDYQERTYYLSGPPDMVKAYEHVLKNLHIKSDQIIKDYFPGLV